MNIDLQRFIDRWAGIPLCAAVSSFDAVRRRIRPAPATDKAPRAIVVILLSEMGSLVLANDMFARLKARYPDAPLHALLFRKNREILDLMQVMDPANVHTVDDRSLTSLLSSLANIPAELVFCFATGNTARIRGLNCGLIETGRAADFVFMDRAQHTAGKTLLESVRLGDIPGVGMVMIDGIVRCGRSRNTPPATEIPVVVGAH